MHERLQDVERLEARDDDRIAVFGRDEVERPSTDDRTDVSGADERVEAKIGRLEQRANRRHDRDVVAEDGKVANARGSRAHQRERGRRGGRFEADGKEHHVASGFCLSDAKRVQRRVHHPHVGAGGLRLE